MASWSCNRCGTALDAHLPAPSTVVCPSCRLAFHVGDDGQARAAEEMPVPPPPQGALRVGVKGSFDGVEIVVLGRTLQSQGTARWSEWCVLGRDGHVHYVSDAQGALHLLKLRGTRPEAPSPATLAPGARLELLAGEVFHVKERGESTTVAAEGQLSYEVKLGARLAFADLDAVGGALATLDWRDGMDAVPELWDGYPVVPSDLGLESGARPDAGSITCPSCKRSQPQRLGGMAETFGCPACLTLSAFRNGAWHAEGGQPDAHPNHILRLGATGTLRGEKLVVAGIMQRHCVVDGETYPWTEYFCLLDDKTLQPEQRHRWIVEQDGHWNVLRPLARGDVVTDGRALRYRGEAYRDFSSVVGVVDYVIGEQPYLTRPGDQATLIDHVNPPRMISIERTGHEEFWTLAEYVEHSELRAAFPDAKELPPKDGVAPNQPNPTLATARWSVLLGALFWLIILVVYLIVSSGARRETVFSQQIVPVDAPAAAGDTAAPDNAFYSAPFAIKAKNRNVSVHVTTSLQNSWETIAVALVHEETGTVRGAALNVEFYSGVDYDGSWTEGSRTASGHLASVPAGNHVLRIEAECERKPCPPFEIRLRSDEPRTLYAFLVMLLLSLFPILAFAYAQYQETQRWMNSTHAA